MANGTNQGLIRTLNWGVAEARGELIARMDADDISAPDRLQRQVDALRCIEALRLYAAAHKGKLPARLDDITVVPIPTDPVTSKPFGYRTAGDTAMLSAPPPPGQTPNAVNALVYKITLKK